MKKYSEGYLQSKIRIWKDIRGRSQCWAEMALGHLSSGQWDILSNSARRACVSYKPPHSISFSSYSQAQEILRFHTEPKEKHKIHQSVLSSWWFLGSALLKVKKHCSKKERPTFPQCFQVRGLWQWGHLPMSSSRPVWRMKPVKRMRNKRR